jgi:hypothetical protein
MKHPRGSLGKAVRKSRNDNYHKFRLSTGSGFTKNILEVRARRFVGDVKMGRSRSQRFS